jgi:hypothetical protein
MPRRVFLPSHPGGPFIYTGGGGGGGSTRWSDILDRPAVFPPEAHTHLAGNILPGTFAAGNFVFPWRVTVTEGLFASDVVLDSTTPLTQGTSLNQISDVLLGPLTVGEALRWDGVKWVNQPVSSGGGASVVVGPTAPAEPTEGDLWFDTTEGGGSGGGGGSGEDTWRTLSVAMTQVARDLTNVTYRLDGGPSVDLVALQYATVPEVLTGEPLPLTEPIVWALPSTTITIAWPTVNYVTFVRAIGHNTARGVYGLATELALDPRAVQ